MRQEQIVFPILRALAKRDWALRLMDKAIKPFNPFSPERPVDPYPLYQRLQETDYALFDKRLRLWLVSGYAECEEVLRAQTSVDRSDFISAIAPYKKLKPETLNLFLGTMVMRNPPDHTRLRKIVNRAFTPRAVAGLEPSIVRIVDDLIANMKAAGSTTDAQREFCDQLPIFAISDMLGLPRGDWDRFKRLSDTLVKFVDPINPFDLDEMESAISEFRSIVEGLADDRRSNPQDDMLSALIVAEDEGDRLDHDELLSMVAILMVAGHETTSGLLGNSLVALDRNPAAKEQFRAEPEIAANAVDELLRYDSPVQNTDRFPTEDITVGGKTIEKDASIFVLLGAANRDPRRYDRPNELILDRPDPRPLSFGHGIHHCLGAALARLEATVALPRFLQAFPDYSVDEANLEWKRSVTVRGPRELPVKLGQPATV